MKTGRKAPVFHSASDSTVLTQWATDSVFTSSPIRPMICNPTGIEVARIAGAAWRM
jgi:hypothetical protein